MRLSVDARELVQHAAGADIFLQVAVGRVQRARNAAVLLALARLAQVDEGDVRPADQRRCACAGVSAQPRRAISCCARPTFMLAGTATSIIFGLAD